jgi:hypothetical protein
MIDSVDTLIAYCGENGRVCPRPSKWNELWEMLPERRRRGGGWEPPLPLILGAWNYTSNREKMQRLGEHIEWAASHGCLSPVAGFLRQLQDRHWHHLSD